MDKHECGNCHRDFDTLYGYKPYTMRTDDEFYCEECFEKVHGFNFEDDNDDSES